MAKTNKCTVTFKQSGSEIKVVFNQGEDGNISYKTDMSKFDKSREQELHFHNFLAGFFLATLSAYAKQANQESVSNEETPVETTAPSEN